MNNTFSLSTDSFLFTSESVGEGHPDKICDQISDAILDACLAGDPLSKVAVETAVKPGLVFIFGQLETKACIDVQKIARRTIREIGYNSPEQDLDYKTCYVVDGIEKHSPAHDVRNGLEQNSLNRIRTLPLHEFFDQLGAGDQV